MNKRQRKKQFKKKYGYNPPKFKVKDIVSVRELLAGAMKTAGAAIKDFMASISKSIDNIKTMPEDEFQEKLGRLIPEQIAMAKLIRYDRGDKGVGQ